MNNNLNTIAPEVKKSENYKTEECILKAEMTQSVGRNIRFTSAQLWNIQKQRKEISYRRFI
ncbi:MAG: hypothetical protein H3C36_03980 [Chitinophagaceae bacterium]|nr:hypothetical protein [Chitinophagaceae bacterium]MCW5914821.1 hypothetical protein [Chitinophagaceae bacterium]MCZ2396163.1 hypothetical protein [Chitinophagales bacterium]